MEQPEFPILEGPASINDILKRLLETIAWEELSLAALIQAEAEKVQSVVNAGVIGPVDAEELIKINLAVEQVLQAVVKKEQLLYKKLTTLLAFREGPSMPAASNIARVRRARKGFGSAKP